jgi:chemotaxis protein MotB
MKRFTGVCMLFVVLMSFGCVSTKEHNARLADIDALKGDVSSLGEKLKQTEVAKSALAADLAKLQKEYEELNKQNQALVEDNTRLDKMLKAEKDELRANIAELRGKLADKEFELDGIRKQLSVLNEEKEKALREKERSIAEMQKTYDSLMGEMNQEIKKGEITITQLKDKLSVNLVEKILFDSGSAEIKKDGKKVLDRVAEILATVPDKQVRVAGHTDNVPIGYRIKDRFPTNWELSTARATTVARYLQDKGIDPNVLSAAGYSEYRPVAPNDTDENKAKNRRIEIDLIPKEVEKAAIQENPKS